MSCNPSIGGIGKGHLVKEVDALGGAMARPPTRPASSSASSMPARARRCAPRAPRPTACCTRRRSAAGWKTSPISTLFQQAVDDLIVEGDRVAGVVTQLGIRFGAAVVLTAGTFLNGLIHVGLENHSAGRMGDPPAISLAAR
jgi:tRNA uridine 5-carboxymethylaminomethyl modification enzyme